MSFFMKFDCVRGKIVYRVVNAEANKEFLETVPHERVLDLAKIYYVLFTDEILDNATITINKYHMKNWGVTEEDIRQAAEKNTEKLLTAKMSSMQSIIKGMRAVECEDTELDRAFSGIGIEMYVLTNHLKMFGASAVFYKDILKSIAESVENDLYIIPSSIHETILIPYDRNVAADRLNEMVMQVNETQLEKEEVLANHIYIYRRNTNNIEIL